MWERVSSENTHANPDEIRAATRKSVEGKTGGGGGGEGVLEERDDK